MAIEGHEDCELCDVCGAHLQQADLWPCLTCGTPLCDICPCPGLHADEVPC